MKPKSYEDEIESLFASMTEDELIASMEQAGCVFVDPSWGDFLETGAPRTEEEPAEWPYSTIGDEKLALAA